MTVEDDKGRAGSSKRGAEAAAGRIGDDVQRAKENISGAAATARDDIAVNLRRLSADVISLKDTVVRQDRDGGDRRSGDRHRRGRRIGREGSSKYPAFRIRGRRTAQSAGRRLRRIRIRHAHRNNERPPLTVATLLRLVARFSQIEGYRCLSLIRALGVASKITPRQLARKTQRAKFLWGRSAETSRAYRTMVANR
jgi:hypothetical protein